MIENQVLSGRVDVVYTVNEIEYDSLTGYFEITIGDNLPQSGS